MPVGTASGAMIGAVSGAAAGMGGFFVIFLAARATAAFLVRLLAMVFAAVFFPAAFLPADLLFGLICSVLTRSLGIMEAKTS